MSTTTAGPSRMYQQRPPYRPSNFFQASGPRNFTSEELSNVETYGDPYYEDYYSEEYSPETYQEFTPHSMQISNESNHSQPYEPPSENKNPYSSEFSENLQQNSENFQDLASNIELT